MASDLASLTDYSNIDDRRNEPPIDTQTWPRPDGVLQLPNVFEQHHGLMIGLNPDKDFAVVPKRNHLGKLLGINDIRPEPMGDGEVSSVGNKVDKILNSLFRDDEKRYQLWPEKVIRGGLTAAGDVLAGEVPQWAVDNVTGEVHTSPQMIEKAQEISALAGTGGLAGGAEGVALNATPSLRPALKYKDKIYKGREGQQHQDVIPKELYPEFEQMAMNGEDISHYNFGFMNHKGQFLDREKALEYAINEGLVDAHAGQYGALTSTLMADSSKPGIAIETSHNKNDDK